MIRIALLALGDLANRRILAILVQALLVTALLFVVIAVVVGWAMAGSDPCALAGLDSCPVEPGTSGVGALLLTLIAAWFLFPGVAVGVLMGFADRIAAAVEQRHYPAAAAAARPIGIGRGALMGLKSGGRVLLFNLLALPFYILLLVTGVGPFVLFVIVNGLAFGRDFAELAAARHRHARHPPRLAQGDPRRARAERHAGQPAVPAAVPEPDRPDRRRGNGDSFV